MRRHGGRQQGAGRRRAGASSAGPSGTSRRRRGRWPRTRRAPRARHGKIRAAAGPRGTRGHEVVRRDAGARPSAPPRPRAAASSALFRNTPARTPGADARRDSPPGAPGPPPAASLDQRPSPRAAGGRAHELQPVDARSRRAAGPGRPARPPRSAGWWSAGSPARGRRAPSASGRGRRPPPRARGRRGAASASTRSGAEPFDLVRADAAAEHGGAALLARARAQVAPRWRPSASTSTGPVVASASVPMWVVVVTSTRQPGGPRLGGQAVDERRLAARAHHRRPRPRGRCRGPGASDGAQRPGVLDHEQPAVDVADHDEVRAREDVGAPGPVEAAGAARVRVVEAERRGPLRVARRRAGARPRCSGRPAGGRRRQHVVRDGARARRCTR